MQRPQPWLLPSVFALSACATTVQPKVETEMYLRAGQAAPFDASATDAKESKYLWSFGDGEKASGAAVRHAYQKPGTYEATLQIKGGGKKGKASIKVVVSPPTALDVLPRDTGLAVVVGDAAGARALWDQFATVAFLQEDLADFKKDVEDEFGFFPLDVDALKARGFDPSKGIGLGLVEAGTEYIPVLAAGVLPGNEGLSWLRGYAQREGLTLEENGDRWKLTDQGEPALVGGRVKDFLVFAPGRVEGAEQVLNAALATSSSESLGDQEWVAKTQARGSVQMYVRGQEFLAGALRDMGVAPDIQRSLQAVSRNTENSNGYSFGLRSEKNQVFAEWTDWPTAEGRKSILAVSPESAPLAVSPELSKKAFWYSSGSIDPLAIGAQLLAQLPPAERRDLLDGVSALRSFTGIDLALDFGAPLGSSMALLMITEPNGLASMIDSGAAAPGEMILAYAVDDEAALAAGVDKLLSTARTFGSGFGLSIQDKTVAGATAHVLNFGFLEAGLLLKDGVFYFALGQNSSTLEKAAELITNPSKSGKGGKAAPFLTVFSLSTLRRDLIAASQKLGGDGDLDEVIELLSPFDALQIAAPSVGQTLRVEATLTFAR